MKLFVFKRRIHVICTTIYRNFGLSNFDHSRKKFKKIIVKISSETKIEFTGEKV